MAPVDLAPDTTAQTEEKPNSQEVAKAPSPFWVVTGACAVLFLIHSYLRWSSGSLKDGLDPIALGLIALALSPWVTSLIEYFKFGGVEFRFVKQQVTEQKKDIEA